MGDHLPARVPFTRLSDRAGTPSMSVPLHAATAESGGAVLPFGVELVARFGDAATVLPLAEQLEQAPPRGGRRSHAHR